MSPVDPPYAVTEPRIAPTTPDDWDDETRALVEALGGMNIFRTLAHHPKLLKRWLVFGAHVLAKSTLPPRERELAILRIGWRCRSEYEWGQHAAIGRGCGLSDEEVLRTTAPAGASGWNAFDAAIVRAVDELHDDAFLSDASWQALSAKWSTEQMLDFVFAVGQYNLV